VMRNCVGMVLSQTMVFSAPYKSSCDGGMAARPLLC
jgi:hypothetical protein